MVLSCLLTCCQEDGRLTYPRRTDHKTLHCCLPQGVADLKVTLDGVWSSSLVENLLNFILLHETFNSPNICEEVCKVCASTSQSKKKAQNYTHQNTIIKIQFNKSKTHEAYMYGNIFSKRPSTMSSSLHQHSKSLLLISVFFFKKVY
jgi:hypothetical protein